MAGDEAGSDGFIQRFCFKFYSPESPDVPPNKKTVSKTKTGSDVRSREKNFTLVKEDYIKEGNHVIC